MLTKSIVDGKFKHGTCFILLIIDPEVGASWERDTSIVTKKFTGCQDELRCRSLELASF